MEFMKKFRIQSDGKISISVHYWFKLKPLVTSLSTCSVGAAKRYLIKAIGQERFWESRLHNAHVIVVSEKHSRLNITRLRFAVPVMPKIPLRTISRRQLPRFPLLVWSTVHTVEEHLILEEK